MKRICKQVILGLALTATMLPASAMAYAGKVIYISPSGVTNGTGATAQLPLPLTKASSVLSNVTTDTTVVFLPGTYNVTKRIDVAGGDIKKKLFVEGAGDKTLFLGNYVLKADGSPSPLPLFYLSRSNVSFANFKAQNVSSVIYSAVESITNDITITNVQAKDVDTAIYAARGSDAPATNQSNRWLIDGLNVDGFVGGAIDIQGAGRGNFTIQNATIKGPNTANVQGCYKEGINIMAYAHDITITNSVVTDVRGTCAAGEYQQGDGIHADDKRGAPKNITIRNVTVGGNGDGNLDIKANNVYVENVLSRGNSTHTAFRFWNFKKYQCVNCRAEGTFSQGHLFVENAQVLMKDPTPTDDAFKIACSKEYWTAGTQVTIQTGKTSKVYACPKPAKK